MTEQQPMGTVDTAQQRPGAGPILPRPTMTPEQQDAEQTRLNKQVYDFRKTCDPFVWEHVIAFHQYANTSDEAFATLQADYAKRAAELLPEPPPPEGRETARRE